MDNFVLVAVFGVLALYFYSSTNIYKSMYKRVVEEKDMAHSNIKSLDVLIKKYEAQIKNSIGTIEDSQDSLQLAREDLQKIKVLNNELAHRNTLLQERVDELYASVGAV